MRAGALALALLATGCAMAPDRAVRAPVGPEVVVRLGSAGQPARDLVEMVAARCWLDGVVRGASMIVDRDSGRVLIVSDTADLLAADFLPPQGGRARLRLSGPVVADPATARRLVDTLDLAVRTGRTDCPIAVG